MMKVTSANFKKEVLESNIPVLVDFYAEWCMPCKMFAPVLESIAEDYEDKVKVVKVNVDESPELAQQYFVMSIPTLKLIKNNEIIGNFIGTMSAEELEDWLDERI